MKQQKIQKPAKSFEKMQKQKENNKKSLKKLEYQE